MNSVPATTTNGSETSADLRALLKDARRQLAFAAGALALGAEDPLGVDPEAVRAAVRELAAVDAMLVAIVGGG